MDPNNQTPPAPTETPVVPTGGQEPSDPGYSHEDLQNQSVRDIAAGQEPPKEPEAPATPPTEPVVETPAPTQPTPEEIAKATADEIEARRVAEEAEAKPAEPTEEEKQATEKYLTWEATFKAKEGRPPTYWEAQNFVKDAVKEDLKRELKEEAEQERQTQATQEEEAKKQRAAEEERINTIVDDELQDLYNNGKMTKIQDPNNPSDQGVVERKALFQTWADVNNDRRAKGLPDIYSATRIFEFYYKKPNAQPPGANAPVQGNRGSATPPSDEESYSNADLKKPWSFFRRG